MGAPSICWTACTHSYSLIDVPFRPGFVKQTKPLSTLRVHQHSAVTRLTMPGALVSRRMWPGLD